MKKSKKKSEENKKRIKNVKKELIKSEDIKGMKHI